MDDAISIESSEVRSTAWIEVLDKRRIQRGNDIDWTDKRDPQGENPRIEPDLSAADWLQS